METASNIEMKSKQFNYKEMRERLAAHEQKQLLNNSAALGAVLLKGHHGWLNMPKQVVRNSYEEVFGND